METLLADTCMFHLSRVQEQIKNTFHRTHVSKQHRKVTCSSDSDSIQVVITDRLRIHRYVLINGSKSFKVVQFTESLICSFLVIILLPRNPFSIIQHYKYHFVQRERLYNTSNTVTGLKKQNISHPSHR